MKEAVNVFRFIIDHPLNRDQKMRAAGRFLARQIRSRLSRDPIVIPFVNHSKLLVSQGMTGATGNIYCGLHEFEDMAFLLHLLRPDDLFIDVGANVGSYTVLAAAVCRAACISIEPIPSTFKHLTENIQLNAISGKVTAKNVGAGSQKESLKFTADQDTTNHVLAKNEETSANVIAVEVDTLDHIVGHLNPTLIKIDVEGFELEVLQGGSQVLKTGSLLALIIEKNENHNRYGHDLTHLKKILGDCGFISIGYDPFKRTLLPFGQNTSASNNIIYVKENRLEFVKNRLLKASAFFVRRVRKEGI